MKDRLPSPHEDHGHDSPLVERASATPAFALAPRHAATRSAPVPHPDRPLPETLGEVQTWMLGAITGPEEAAERAAAVLTAGPRLPARDRLEIYRYGYAERLVECLADDYPVLAATLGDGKFRALATAYIERYPSSSPNLNAFGRHMEELCRSASPAWLDEPRVFFAELAALEWALVVAIHAAPAPALDLAALQALPPEAWATARLVPSGTVTVLDFSYPVNRYFQEYRNKGRQPSLPSPSPSATAVYRKEELLWRMDLTPAMKRVLVALLGGRTIAESLGQMSVNESDPEAVAEAERSVMIWFRDWALGGFFADVATG